MHKEHLKATLKKYERYTNTCTDNVLGKMIRGRLDPKDYVRSFFAGGGHLLWMIDTLRNDPKFEEDPNKTMRWLCFIQGVLWGAGYLNVEEARIDNIKILTGEDPIDA